MDYKNIDITIMRKLITDEDEYKNVMIYLKSVDENEKKKRKMLQKIGMEKARRNNVKLGRPAYPLPSNFFTIAALVKHRRLPVEKACKVLKMPRSTFYKKLNQYQIEIEEQYKKMIEEKERINSMKIEEQMKQLGISVEDIDNTTEADREVIIDAEDVSEREA